MSEDERNILLNWANKLRQNEYDRLPVLPEGGKGLYHYLLSPDDTISDKLVWTIRNRIIEKEILNGYNESHPNVRDLLLVIEKGECLPKHIDGNKGQFIRTRFNVFITVPENCGETYYGENKVETLEGSYVLCRSGIDEHYCTINLDNNPRISLSFGFLLPFDKLDELTSNKSIGTYKYYPLSPPKNN